MLFPRTRAWTLRQRWLIAGAVAVALVAFATAVYSYERYHRGLRETALVGTWSPETSQLYYDFQRDGVLVVLDEDGQPTGTKGKWYAGGPNIYIRFPVEILKDRQLVVWRIIDILPEQFRVRSGRHDDQIMVWHRVKPPNASNHALQPTASRRE